MCSRFWGAMDGQRVLTATEARGGAAIIEALEEAIRNSPKDAYANVAPTDTHGVIHMNHHRKRVISRMKWGFTVPDREAVVNARAETMLEKPLFARHVPEKRCLIAVQGYYEWDDGKPKQPYCIRLKDTSVFAFGGVWREYVGEKQFVVITVDANPLIAPLNDRMPCLVAPEDFDLWLEGDCHEALAKVCRPYPAEKMTMYPVTRAMGNPKYKVEDAHLPLQTLFGLDDF